MAIEQNPFEMMTIEDVIDEGSTPSPTQGAPVGLDEPIPIEYI